MKGRAGVVCYNPPMRKPVYLSLMSRPGLGCSVTGERRIKTTTTKG